MTRSQKRTWDLIALLLVEEAGGKVTHIDGTDNFDFRQGKDAENNFVATNGLLHALVLKEIKNK